MENSIALSACELLSQVAYHEDITQKRCKDNRVDAGHPNAGSVGLPYDEVLRLLKEKWPEAGTNIACLRDYCYYIQEGIRQPFCEFKVPRRRDRVKYRSLVRK